MLLLVLGCASAPPAERPPSRELPVPVDPLQDALARIAAQDPPCRGEMASVTVWHDEDGSVGRLFYQGDLTACSHAPAAWYDALGNLLDTVPMEPVTPGSDRARYFENLQAQHIDGRTRGERLRLP